jgi:hypothetical protein
VALDPIGLVAAIRAAQERIAALAAHGGNADPPAPVSASKLADFLSGLGTAWQAGEVRATHRTKLKARRYWRSRVDPFAEVAVSLRSWLDAEPDLQATDLLARLEDAFPGRYPAKLLRTLQRRVRAWRREIAHLLVFGPSSPVVPSASGTDAGGSDVAPAPQAPPQLQTTMIAR